MSEHKKAFENIIEVISLINRFEFNKANVQSGGKYFSSMSKIEELVALATPQKLIHDDEESIFCPNCKTDYRLMTFDRYCSPNYENPFCGECGQALDWYNT